MKSPAARKPAKRTRALTPGARIAPRARPKAAPAVRGAAALAEQALDLALIGNCRIAALVNPTGRIVWWCYPRFDADPVFSRLLAGDEEKGVCDVVLVGALDDPEFDASVLRIAEVGLVPADDPRFASTCDVIGEKLIRNGRIMRYTADDDFGAPETAFLACNFWYIEALVAVGRRDEARDFFTGLLVRRNSFGLLSEDIHPKTGALWGNFPQTYSMAGIINVATRLSNKWEDVWCRVSS
ncbi:MAG TPA: glycoside hydrolase family 15 protein [Stellaceae bacterium]|nr:glycoside hydrolase family 15 protein [Stellaceae bacterium]